MRATALELMTSRIALGFLYWAVAIMAIPYFRGYRVEESAEVLQDGTTITKLIRKEV